MNATCGTLEENLGHKDARWHWSLSPNNCPMEGRMQSQIHNFSRIDCQRHVSVFRVNFLFMWWWTKDSQRSHFPLLDDSQQIWQLMAFQRHKGFSVPYVFGLFWNQMIKYCRWWLPITIDIYRLENQRFPHRRTGILRCCWLISRRRQKRMLKMWRGCDTRLPNELTYRDYQGLR